MDKYNLKTLTLVGFNKDNKEHLDFLQKSIDDAIIKKRLQGFFCDLLHKKDDHFFYRGFLVYDQVKIIGYMNIGRFNKCEKAVYLKAFIDSDERGKKYGKTLLSETANYIFDNYEFVEVIKLVILPDNTSSIKTALSCGFKHVEFNNYNKKRTLKKSLY